MTAFHAKCFTVACASGKREARSEPPVTVIRADTRDALRRASVLSVAENELTNARVSWRDDPANPVNARRYRDALAAVLTTLNNDWWLTWRTR
jgi:hypothetical protein